MIFCLFALQKNNYRAQTSILKTIPAVPTALKVFDF